MSAYADLAQVRRHVESAGPRLISPAPSSWFEDCVVEPEEWLVERLVPVRSYTGIFGRRGSAKSFLALDMACSGAMGAAFLGEAVRRFGSIYCVGEKKSRFGKRVQAWKLARGATLTPLGVRFRWAVPDLLNEAEVSAFISEVNELKTDFDARGAPLGAIFFDTLARGLKHANVSDPDAAGTAIEAIQRIVEECEVTVLPLAHVAKAEGSLTQKGAGEWEDAADALIRIDRKDQEPLRVVTLAKQSDEADGLAYAFELEVVDVGTAPISGRRVTSCVIRQSELPDSGTKPFVPRLNAAAETVLAALCRLEEAGQTVTAPAVPGVKAGTQAVTLHALRELAYSIGLQRPSMPPPEAPKTEQIKWLEARKKAFQRAVERLQEARKIRAEGDYVWRL